MEAQEQVQNEQDFRGAFSEVAGKSQGEPLTVEVVQKEEPPPEKPVVEAAKPVVEAAKPVVETEKVKEPNYQELYEQEKVAREAAVQRMSSWEGRLSAAERKNQELINTLNEQLKEKAGKETVQVPPSSSPEEDELIKTFTQEMGDDFVKPVSILIKRAIAESTKTLTDELAATKAKLENYDRDYIVRHYEQITEAHPDVEKYAKSGELNEWAKTLPYQDANTAINILTRGNARQVIALLDMYKKVKGIPNPRVKEEIPTKPEAKPEAKPKVEEKPKVVPAAIDVTKIKAAAAVKDKGPSLLPKTEPDKDDFEGTFNEITK